MFIARLSQKKEFMESRRSALSSPSRCEDPAGISAHVGPFRRHLHKFLDCGLHLKADELESAFVVCSNGVGPYDRGLEKRQHHRIFGIQIKYSIDVGVVQRLEICKDGCL